MGSDEFGGTIFIFAGTNQPANVETVIARFSNVELFHVGQSFRKGNLYDKCINGQRVQFFTLIFLVFKENAEYLSRFSRYLYNTKIPRKYFVLIVIEITYTNVFSYKDYLSYEYRCSIASN